MLAVCNALYISADVSFNASIYGEDGKGEDKEKKIEKISNGIEKFGDALKESKDLITAGKVPDFKAALTVVVKFSEFGSVIFPQMKLLSSSLGLLNGLIDSGESADEKITKGIYMLCAVKYSFNVNRALI